MKKLASWRMHHTVVLLLWVGGMACSKNGSNLPAENDTPPATIDSRYPTNLIIDSVSLSILSSAITANAQLASAYNTIVAEPAASALARAIQPVASGNSDNFSSISNQANDCRLLAAHWLYLRKNKPTESHAYYNKLVSTLLAWVNVGNSATTHLPNETAYLGFFEAYSAIRSKLSATDRARIDNWLIARAEVFRNFPPRVNNWETIRLTFLYYLGYILQSPQLLNHAETAYGTLLNVNLLPGGKSEDLVDRDAFAYHAYNLSFYGRILRAKHNFEGEAIMKNFRDRMNNINVCLQDMVDYWQPFLTSPATNVHIEFVNTHYAPDKQRSDYNKPYQPASSVYALEELLLPFPEAKEYLELITGGNRFNRKLSGFLYWP